MQGVQTQAVDDKTLMDNVTKFVEDASHTAADLAAKVNKLTPQAWMLLQRSTVKVMTIMAIDLRRRSRRIRWE